MEINNEDITIIDDRETPEEEEEIETTIIDDRDPASQDSDEESSEEEVPVYDLDTQGIPDWAAPKVVDEILEFKDGSTIAGRAIADRDEENLWVNILDENIDFTQAAIIFMNPNKTDKITFHSSLYNTPVYEGFTRMAGIEISKDGKFTIRLKKT